jgi:hypothetical protein
VGGTKYKVKPACNACKPRSNFLLPSLLSGVGNRVELKMAPLPERGAQGSSRGPELRLLGSHETSTRKVFQELNNESKHSGDEESPPAELGQLLHVSAASLFLCLHTRQRPCGSCRPVDVCQWITDSPIQYVNCARKSLIFQLETAGCRVVAVES